jgi:ABC-2 type transport system permease protein
LSGTFYSVKNLPEMLQNINIFNPFFYMIDGFRFSLTNHADSNINAGIVILMLSNVALFYITSKMLDKGFRIKG